VAHALATQAEECPERIRLRTTAGAAILATPDFIGAEGVHSGLDWDEAVGDDGKSNRLVAYRF